jgi:ABC-type bacteriocin/lantibiotic exporter with double-glycine peptidase domain
MGGRRRRVSVEKSDLPLREQAAQMRELFGFLSSYRGWLAAAIIGVLFASALGLVFPLIMGNLVDTAIDVAGDTETLDRIALLLLGVFLFQARPASTTCAPTRCP